jgi:division protein CdvB (Snf7/Vps24/ESCRT-III family)
LLPEKTQGKLHIWDKFGGKLHPSSPPPASLKDRIASVLSKLKIQVEKLDQISARLQERDKEIFDKCVKAEVSKDEAHAAIYANECAEIRKMAKVVLHSQLALERVILRLETIEELGDVLTTIGPVAGIVKGIKSQLTGIIPEVAYELGEINDTLDSTIAEAGDANARSESIKASDEEAQRVLGEANAIAEQRMKERFPELPSTLATPQANLYAAIEDRVYDYIVSHGREISLSECASALGVPAEVVRDAVESLSQKGKITIESTEAA